MPARRPRRNQVVRLELTMVMVKNWIKGSCVSLVRIIASHSQLQSGSQEMLLIGII
jgi:hypothetical protein